MIILLGLIYQLSLIPFALYSGYHISIFGIDHGNITYLLLVITLFSIVYFIAGFETNTINYSFILYILFILIIIIYLLSLLLYFFVYYEFISIILFLILYFFIKSFYKIRTAFYYFIFSIIGSFIFSLSCLLFFFSDCILSELLLLVPFLIKVPVFPFYY